MYDYMGSGMGGYMWLFWLIPFGIIIWAAVMLTGHQKEQAKSPLDILQERYARGEIDEQEYKKKKQNLQL